MPLFTKREFGAFYRDLFDKESKADGMRSVYLEYAWNMATCDPCVGLPLSPKQLVELGTFWLGDRFVSDVFVTRLHIRYTAKTFPEDLKFQETRNISNFQGRYILRHPYAGEANCAAADDYRQALEERAKRNAKTLHDLTGWPMNKIRAEMAKPAPRPVSTPSAVFQLLPPINTSPYFETVASASVHARGVSRAARRYLSGLANSGPRMFIPSSFLLGCPAHPDRSCGRKQYVRKRTK